MVVTNMTVATANLNRLRIKDEREYMVCAPVCVAQASEVREYEQKGDCTDAHCRLVELPVNAELRSILTSPVDSGNVDLALERL